MAESHSNGHAAARAWGCGEIANRHANRGAIYKAPRRPVSEARAPGTWLACDSRMIVESSWLTRAVAWFLMLWIWVIGTAGCGAMLALQDKKMNERQVVSAAECNRVAAQAAQSGDSHPAPGPELAHGTRGLEPRYLPSSRA